MLIEFKSDCLPPPHKHPTHSLSRTVPFGHLHHSIHSPVSQLIRSNPVIVGLPETHPSQLVAWRRFRRYGVLEIAGESWWYKKRASYGTKDSQQPTVRQSTTYSRTVDSQFSPFDSQQSESYLKFHSFSQIVHVNSATRVQYLFSLIFLCDTYPV